MEAREGSGKVQRKQLQVNVFDESAKRRGFKWPISIWLKERFRYHYESPNRTNESSIKNTILWFRDETSHNDGLQQKSLSQIVVFDNAGVKSGLKTPLQFPSLHYRLYFIAVCSSLQLSIYSDSVL
ncbi:hypothetical protein Tcan_00653, partial [Toxocara canis]